MITLIRLEAVNKSVEDVARELNTIEDRLLPKKKNGGDPICEETEVTDEHYERIASGPDAGDFKGRRVLKYRGRDTAAPEYLPHPSGTRFLGTSNTSGAITFTQAA